MIIDTIFWSLIQIFDILKFSEHINKSLLQIKEIVSNVDDAIKIIEDAVKLFCNNYDKYLKHYNDTNDPNNPSSIYNYFMLDCYKEIFNLLDLNIIKQIKKIIMFYKRKNISLNTDTSSIDRLLKMCDIIENKED